MRDELERKILELEKELILAKEKLANFLSLPENNIYSDLEMASVAIENILYGYAKDACEGKYNCGLDEYTKLFMVDGKTYRASLKPEYNRHDKTYYYIETHTFTIEEV